MSALADAPALMRAAGEMVPCVLHAAQVYAGALRAMRAGMVADALRRSTEAAYYLDPTTMLRHGTAGDIARKQRLLDAAATLVRAVTEVEEEAVGAAVQAAPGA